MNGTAAVPVPPLFLVLTFSEYVSATTVLGTGVTLQPVQNSTNASTAHTLTQRGVTSQISETVVELQVDAVDLAAIRARPRLGQTADLSYISMAADSASDAFTNGLTGVPASTGIKATANTADLTPPAISRYTLDLNSHQLIMTMSENVLATSVRPERITLQSSETSAAVSVTLSNASTSSVTGAVLTINILSADQDRIKQLDTLAFSRPSSFVSTRQGYVQDIAQNDADAILVGKAQNVDTFIRDSVRPNLLRWDLNLNTRRVTLYFDQVVNVSTLDASDLTIQQRATTAGGGQSHTLTGGQLITTAFNTSLAFEMLNADANSIKQLTSLAISNASAFLVAPSTSIKDMAGNFLVDIVASNALQVRSFVGDVSRPQVNKFDFDLDAGTLTLSFSETVNVSSLQVGQVTLLNARTGATRTHTLSAQSRALHADSSTLVLTLGLADLNSLKNLSICTAKAQCFVSFTDTTILDMVGQAVVPRLPTDARGAEGFNNDSSVPQLRSFVSFDLRLGQLTVSFSETVNIETFTPTAIVLRSLFEVPRENYTLTGGTLVTTLNSSIVVLNLTQADLDAIKNDANLCSRRSNCYFAASSSLVQDMAGNSFSAITDGPPGFIVQQLVDDNNAPQLVLFDLDINTGVLLLSWSEPVRSSSLRPERISLVNAAANATFNFSLTGGLATAANGLVLNVTLSAVDLQALKSSPVAANQSFTYITLAAGAVSDMAFTPLPSVAIPLSRARPVNRFATDSQPPTITRFHINMDTDRLELTFSEPIRTSPFDATRFSLKPNCSAPANTTRRLTGGTLLGNPQDGVSSVSILLNAADLIALKQDTNFATHSNNSYLQVDANTVQDQSGVFMAAVPCLKPSLHTSDVTRLQLLNYSINMQTGWFNLTFSDVVIVSSLDATAIQFQHAATSSVGQTYRLTSRTNFTMSMNGYTLAVLLNNLDLFALKSVNGLATNENTTYITLRASAIDGPGNRDVVAITDGKALKVTQFIADNTAPTFSSATLDLDSGSLNLTFTDTVSSGSVNVSGITLANRANLALATSQFSLLGGTVEQSTDGRTVSIVLLPADLNRLTRLQGLGTTTADTFISFTAGTVRDLATNPVAALSGTAGQGVTVVS
eukprot:scpid34370/ scgid34477/ 